MNIVPFSFQTVFSRWLYFCTFGAKCNWSWFCAILVPFWCLLLFINFSQLLIDFSRQGGHQKVKDKRKLVCMQEFSPLDSSFAGRHTGGWRIHRPPDCKGNNYLKTLLLVRISKTTIILLIQTLQNSKARQRPQWRQRTLRPTKNCRGIQCRRYFYHLSLHPSSRTSPYTSK